ncbi:MAG: GDP-mannose 4,6-dehydratase, partial [Dokdonella sp.]
MSRRYTRALITGINGQDGAWLAAHLLGEGIEVFGTHRPTSPAGNWRLQELGLANHANLHLHALDAGNIAACRDLLADFEPQAIFHLAGQSRVADS